MLYVLLLIFKTITAAPGEMSGIRSCFQRVVKIEREKKKGAFQNQTPLFTSSNKAVKFKLTLE